MRWRHKKGTPDQARINISVEDSNARDVTAVYNSYSGEPGELLTEAIQSWEKARALAELDRFVERGEPVAKVKEALASLKSGYIVIKGPVGSGKTALAARLVELNDCVFHFAGIGQGRNPERARRNIAAQLITKWDLADKAPDGRFPPKADNPDWLARVLDAAAGKRDAEAERGGGELADADIPPLIVVVDALDEADQSVHPYSTRIPLGLPRPAELADGVFIIVTCHGQDSDETMDISELSCVELKPKSDDNIAAVRKYIEQFVQGDKADRVLSGRLERAGVSAARFVDKLAGNSEGSWLYARHVLAELRSKARLRDIADLDTLPIGLANFYEERYKIWRKPKNKWKNMRLPVLAVLAALPGSATAEEIARYAGVSREKTVKSVTDWLEGDLRPFLDAEKNGGSKVRYRLSHRSLRDSIVKDADLASPAPSEGVDREFFEECRRAHKRIADILIPRDPADLAEWQKVPRSGCQALPRHAALGGSMGKLLSQAAFHLSCPPVEIFRVKGYLADAGDRAAISALEMAQVHWNAGSLVTDRAWWLHVWARRFHEDRLADSAWLLSERPQSVARAIWSGTPHRVLTGQASGDVRQPDLVWCIAPVELTDRTTALAAGTGKSIRLWDPATGSPIGEPMDGHCNTVQALAMIWGEDGRPRLAAGDADGWIITWGLSGGRSTGLPLGACTDAAGKPSPVRSLATAVLDGHYVLVSGDGARKIGNEAAQDGTITRWDQGRPTPIGRHQGPVAAVAVLHLPGRTVVASGGDTDGIRLWDLQPGRQTPFDLNAALGSPLIAGAVSALTSINVQDEAPLLVTAKRNGELDLWRVEADAAGRLEVTRVGSFGQESQPVRALSLIPRRGRFPLVVSGCVDGNVRIWDPETRKPHGEPLIGHTGPVWSVSAVTIPEGDWTLVASAGGDWTLRLWDFERDQHDRQLHGHRGPVASIAALRHPGEGELLASAGNDGIIYAWNVRDAQPDDGPALTLTASAGTPIASIAAIAASEDHATLASGGGDHAVQVWGFTRDRAAHRTDVPHGAAAVTSLTGATDGAGRVLLAFGDKDGGVETWRLGSPHSQLAAFSAHPYEVLAVALVEPEVGQTLLATSGLDRSCHVRLWDPVTGEEAEGEPFTGHKAWVRSILPVDLGGETLLATGGDDNVIHLWDPQNRARTTATLKGHTGTIHAILNIDLPGQSGLIASCGSDGTVRLWDLPNAAALGEPLIGHVGPVRSLAFAAGQNGPLLATAGADHSIMLWDLRHLCGPKQSTAEPSEGNTVPREMEGNCAAR